MFPRSHSHSFVPIFLALVCGAAAASNSSSSTADCWQQSCGGVNVSYPFGLSNRRECPPFSSFFNLTCDPSSNQLFLHNLGVQLTSANSSSLLVTHIANTSLVVDISSMNASLPPLCPSRTNSSSCSTNLTATDSFSQLTLPPFPGPFYISDDNEFGSFGCTYGVFVITKLLPLNMSSPASSSSPLSSPPASPALPPSPEQQIASPAEAPAPTSSGDDVASSETTDVAVGGCAVICPGDEAANASRCGDGRTCCVTPLPVNSTARLAYYNVIQSPLITENIGCCKGGTNYTTLFHSSFSDMNRGIYRLKLRWALPSNLTHNQTQLLGSPDYACSSNSIYTIVDGVPGYLCSCKPGYRGDGYLKGEGCSEINECHPEGVNDCVSISNCENLPLGNYTCRCKSRFHEGDGRKNGSGCQFSHRWRLGLLISAAFVVLVLMIAIFFCFVIWWRKREKKKYFMQHGGLELQEILRSRSGGDTRIFKEEELTAATNNYADNMKLGVGGFGTVFKGILEDGRVVAIKKANMRGGDEEDREQFLNEMAILVRINHRHIVRLLGCCLETKVPSLVYEFISNGTLQQNLGGENGTVVIGWQQRLEVARQMAEALAYLHAAASPPILHRDVKSANVLLDDNFNAKVADFGLSRIVLEGSEQEGTALQGTIGYLDPEYFLTLELSDKSDVYSLGVVLVELITALKPVDSRNREASFANLALLFIHHMEEGKLDELIDARLTHNMTNHDSHSSIMAVAALARSCLHLQGSRRPSMNEIVDRIRHVVQSSKSGYREDQDKDENVPLVSSNETSETMECMEASAIMPDDQHSTEYYGIQSGSVNNLLASAPTLPR